MLLQNIYLIPDSRFVHAVVKLGDKVVALGGKRRNPDVYLDTIESFSLDNGWTKINRTLETARSNFGYTLVPHSFIPGCKIKE